MIYQRTVSIRRQASPEVAGSVAVGLQGYQGRVASEASPGAETVIATGLAASIQAHSDGRAGGKNVLPGNAAAPTTWRIFIPFRALAKGVARDHDVVVDDEGYRYSVTSAYWNLLGYRLDCVRLES